MRSIEKALWGFPAALFCVFLAVSGVFAQEETIRAKIGIVASSGSKSWLAKSRDQVAAGVKLRVYVRPEVKAHVYVVHTDGKAVTLLAYKVVQDSTLVLPSEKGAYEIDGESASEAFTVVCGLKEIEELSALKDTAMPYKQWAALEEKLIRQSRIEMGKAADKPVAIAGSVRGVQPDRSMPTFSARAAIVKKYAFSVKK